MLPLVLTLALVAAGGGEAAEDPHAGVVFKPAGHAAACAPGELFKVDVKGLGCYADDHNPAYYAAIVGAREERKRLLYMLYGGLAAALVVVLLVFGCCCGGRAPGVRPKKSQKETR